MGQQAQVAAIIRDLHAAIDRLNTSLLPSPQSSLSHLTPSIPPINHSTTTFNPVNPIPLVNPIPRSTVTNPSRSLTDVIRDSILSQPASHPPLPRPPPTSKTPKNHTLTQNRVTTKLERLRSQSKKGIPVCFKWGDTGHTTSACRNSVTCFACHKVGH